MEDKKDRIICAQLSNELLSRLRNLSLKTKRSQSYYIREALQEFLDKKEEYFLAISKLEDRMPIPPISELLDIQIK